MTARIGARKTGGRTKGSLDKGQRQLVTAEMASDLLTVYKKLGGVKWLLKFAQDNPAEFLRQGLSRLFPAPQKDDADFVQQNNFNFDSNSVEAARRVAYALAAALHSDPSKVPRDITPTGVPRWQPLPEPLPVIQPEPVEDPEREQPGSSAQRQSDEGDARAAARDRMRRRSELL
ncbi:hypothetical protein ACIQUS_23190 [Pseudomonas sp. NPDC090755]|uniref:hypothetical protein n=1 Tax=Pseudomonas sp. NPDC090755 TaxID=3364481 RepID=UPI00383B1225